MLLRLRTPATNDRGPLYAEQAFAALHQANARRLPLRLIFGIHAGSVVQMHFRAFLETKIKAGKSVSPNDDASRHLPDSLSR